MRTPLALGLAAAVATVPTAASAHGLFGHVHVTGYAIENLPPGELRAMFHDPAVFDAALMGACFPDTGYALGDTISRNYAEAAHWEPFIQAMVEHIRTQYGPTYETPEEQKLVAFLLGMGSHGMQDELFDSTFDLELHEHDGEFDADTAIDGMFAMDGHARMFPTGDYVPMADLLTVYHAEGQAELTEAKVQRQIDVVLQIYVNAGFGLDTAISIGESRYARTPFTYEHYLDGGVPGTFRAEIEPTGAYMQALWDRLHGRYPAQATLIHAWPDAPRRLRSGDPATVASYVTLVFGIGVDFPSLTPALADAAGTPHPFQFVNTRWGTTQTRVVQFRPTAAYVPGGRYVAHLDEGAARIDGTTTTAIDVPFQVECDAPDATLCPPLGPIEDPAIDGSGFPDAARAGDGGCVASPGRGTGTHSGLVAVLAGSLAAAIRRRPSGVGRRRPV